MNMQISHESGLWALLESVVGTSRTVRLFDALVVDTRLLRLRGTVVSRAELAQALTMLLFEDVMRRVPVALAYVRDAIRAGRKLEFDHGALRAVATECGALPSGELAFRRLLEPLGFSRRDVYALDRLAMTGHAYAHDDAPQSIAQFFVSELHPERFGEEFHAVVRRVVGASRDPLSAVALNQLARLRADRTLPFHDAVTLLPNLVACFDRHHDEPSWLDYRALLASSKEMAWIATEGNAFNHATDRVADVGSVAAAQRAKGRPIKDELEISASGRVIQTAFLAAEVERHFVDADGSLRTERVPGSFHELITRQEEAPGVLDLRFDSGNAQGIFAMTAPAAGGPRRAGDAAPGPVPELAQ